MVAIVSNLGFTSSPVREVISNSKDNVLHMLICTLFRYPCPKHFSTAPACSWYSPMCKSHDPEGTSHLKVVLGTQQSHDLTFLAKYSPAHLSLCTKHGGTFKKGA